MPKYHSVGVSCGKLPPVGAWQRLGNEVVTVADSVVLLNPLFPCSAAQRVASLRNSQKRILSCSRCWRTFSYLRQSLLRQRATFARRIIVTGILISAPWLS